MKALMSSTMRCTGHSLWNEEDQMQCSSLIIQRQNLDSNPCRIELDKFFRVLSFDNFCSNISDWRFCITLKESLQFNKIIIFRMIAWCWGMKFGDLYHTKPCQILDYQLVDWQFKFNFLQSSPLLAEWFVFSTGWGNSPNEKSQFFHSFKVGH